MIDQKIISVDNRGIIRDLVMRIAGESYTRELGPIGQFFDDHYKDVFFIINNHYVAQLSHGRNVSMASVEQQVNALVTTHMCRYFPSMTLNDMRSATQVFMEVLTNAFNSRVPSNLGVWDKCELLDLNMDTYVVNCTRQTTERQTGAPGSGVFIHPINA